PGPPIAPEGERLDPEEGVVLANTFYSHFVSDALARHGRLADALRLMRESYGPMLDSGAETLWESVGPTASLCHGFSASPTYQLTRRVLGVGPAAPGFAEAEVGPDLADLEWAEGAVPTPLGEIEARLEKTGDGFRARYRAPAGCALVPRPPPGLTLVHRADGGRGQAEFSFERIDAATADDRSLLDRSI
ncbi:MAG: alpha-L-rhamnosidase C-terminal domain-containing protein, partial [Caulobacteraceae bacterium]